MRATSIVHRSDTLTTLISVYKNHMILDNTNLNKNNYISNTLVAHGCHLLALSQWEKFGLCARSIVSMGKPVWVWRGVNIQVFTNIIHIFLYFVYFLHG